MKSVYAQGLYSFLLEFMKLAKKLDFIHIIYETFVNNFFEETEEKLSVITFYLTIQIEVSTSCFCLYSM